MASSDLSLSKGSIEAMLSGRVKPPAECPPAAPFTPPLLQLLGLKAMTNHRVRVVLYDGVTVCQHGIVVNEEAERLFNEGRLAKFSLIRVLDYSINAVAKKDMPILMISQLEHIMGGNEVGEKLENFTDYVTQTGATAAAAPRSPAKAVAATTTTSYNSHSNNQRLPPGSPAQAASSAFPPLIVTKKPAAKSPSSSGGPVGSLRQDQVAPINCLTPFFSAWVVRVRVISKTPMKMYNNARGSGRVFSFDTVDESGELRFSAFNADADRLYGLVERGGVYLISRGTIKPANKKFSTLNSEYEVTLNNTSVIEEVTDESAAGAAGSTSSLPRMRYKFVPLADLEKRSAGDTIDVIGVIRTIGQPESLTSRKTGKPLTKRDVALVDRSGVEARLTLWNEQADSFAAEPGEVVALKSVIVGDFKGKTLSTGGGTLLDLEPTDLPERAVLRQWWTGGGGKDATFTSLSNAGGGGGAGGRLDETQRFVGQLTTKLVTSSNGGNPSSTSTGLPVSAAFSAGPPIYSTIHGTLSVISNRKEGQPTANHLYKSCGNVAAGRGGTPCQKKVTDERGDGLYYCAKCDRASPTFKWRFMLSVAIADATGSTWVTIFQENAEKLLDKTAEELAELAEHSPEAYSAEVNRLRFTDHTFRLGTKIEEYMGDPRLRSSLFSITPTLNGPLERSRRLLTMIPMMAEQLN